MKVLVTGAQGFLGPWVLRALEGHEVLPFRGDVRDRRTFPGGRVDAVIHLAARIPHRQEVADADFRATNVGGTAELLDVYADAHFVLASTRDVERAEPDAYAASKLEAERLVARRTGNAIVRLPSVFGPMMRQKKLIPMLARKFRHGTPCEVRNDDEREYLFVADAAAVMVGALQRSGLITSEGYRIRNRALAATMEQIARGRFPVARKPGEAAFLDGLVAAMEQLP